MTSDKSGSKTPSNAARPAGTHKDGYGTKGVDVTEGYEWPKPDQPKPPPPEPKKK